MITDRECREEEHEAICRGRDVDQGIGCDDLFGTRRPQDEPWEDEE